MTLGELISELHKRVESGEYNPENDVIFTLYDSYDDTARDVELIGIDFVYNNSESNDKIVNVGLNIN